METLGCRIRVLVVDDHPLMREGIAAVVDRQADMRVVGEASTGEQALIEALRLSPDVAIVDLLMPGIGGLATIELLRRDCPSTQVVLLSSFGTPSEVRRARAAGAGAFLRKNEIRHGLAEAVRRLHALPGVGVDTSIEPSPPYLRAPGLSAPELDVLQYVSHGRADKRIAALLSVSEAAVKARLRRILKKLGARDRAQAVSVGLERGLLSRDGEET